MQKDVAQNWQPLSAELAKAPKAKSILKRVQDNENKQGLD